MNKKGKADKELIEKICTYTKGLIRRGEYRDDPQQVIDFAKNELSVFVPPTELDRLVRKYMSMPNQTLRGLDTKPVPYTSFQDYIARTRVDIRMKQHGDTHNKGIPPSSMLSCDSRAFKYNRKK